jgi:hypothetical protein
MENPNPYYGIIIGYCLYVIKPSNEKLNKGRRFIYNYTNEVVHDEPFCKLPDLNPRMTISL